MPTYEYVCRKCGFEFEEFQSIAAEPVSVCPRCGATAGVRRKISGGTGLIFKGSGFYITDYKNKHTESDDPSVKTKTKNSEAKKTKKKDE
jgi:putative FmdB family regulatory protein